jgi:hypothetical protein
VSSRGRQRACHLWRMGGAPEELLHASILAVASCSGWTPAAASLPPAVEGRRPQWASPSWGVAASSMGCGCRGKRWDPRRSHHSWVPLRNSSICLIFFLNFVDLKVSPKNFKLEKFTCLLIKFSTKFCSSICSEFFILTFLPPNVFDHFRYRYFLPLFFQNFGA